MTKPHDERSDPMTNPKPKPETTDPQAALSAAFVAAWSEIQTLAHDANNPHFKNKYTSYDRIMQAIRPVMSRHDLCVIQPPFVVDDTNKAGINTIVRHKLGATLDLGCIAVPSKKDNDPQAFGSAMTYAKRYSLCAALGIPTGDDDDGNAAAATPPATGRAAAMGAINQWSGMSGEDATNAAKMVVELAGSKEPEALIDYVNKHKHEDFITHTSENLNHA